MKAKKLVAVGMTVLMLGGLFVGCGNSADTSTGANSGNNSGNTMNGWVYSGAPNTWGQQVAGVEVQKYLAGEADWDEVTKTCIEQWSELRKQQNN